MTKDLLVSMVTMATQVSRVKKVNRALLEIRGPEARREILGTPGLRGQKGSGGPLELMDQLDLLENRSAIYNLYHGCDISISSNTS